MSLFPTPTRLRLLESVADGKVCRYGNDRTYQDGWKEVTHQVWLMEQAGWVQLGPEVFPGKRRWDLTDEGRRVLASTKAAEPTGGQG